LIYACKPPRISGSPSPFRSTEKIPYALFAGVVNAGEKPGVKFAEFTGTVPSVLFAVWLRKETEPVGLVSPNAERVAVSTVLSSAAPAALDNASPVGNGELWVAPLTVTFWAAEELVASAAVGRKVATSEWVPILKAPL
jgi:hypothetical protein